MTRTSNKQQLDMYMHLCSQLRNVVHYALVLRINIMKSKENYTRQYYDRKYTHLVYIRLK